MEIELHKQEIQFILLAREISGTNKDSISPEDVCPFPKPGLRFDRRQRRKVKSRILTNSPIMEHI